MRMFSFIKLNVCHALLLLLCCSTQGLIAQDAYTPIFEEKSQLKHTVVLPDNAKRINHLVVKGNILEEIVNVKKTNLSFNLFADIKLNVSLIKDPGHFYNELEVFRGRTKDNNFNHLPNYYDVIMVVNPSTNRITAQLHTSKGIFEISPTSEFDEYRITEWKEGEIDCGTRTGHIENAKDIHKNNSCNDQDENGRYVADVFVGYSDQAAAVAVDIEAHALSMIEMVNNGLANSIVDNIYLRLVGVGQHPQNDGIITSVLTDVRTWFADEIDVKGADFVASIQVRTGAPGEVAGWGSLPGYTSVNDVNGAAAIFRHEIGHNMGSNHCTPGILPYAAGYDNGNVKTHMCGNNINFYSTPLVSDESGLPLGDASTADNARLWKERAGIVANRQERTIFFNENDLGCNDEAFRGRFYIEDVNSGLYLATENGNTAIGTALVISDVQDNSTLWELIPISAVKYRMMHVSSGRFIDVPGSSSEVGQNLIIWNGHGGNNQNFQITQVSNDEVRIQAFNGLCLVVENASQTSGVFAEQNSCDDSQSMLWKLIPTMDTISLNISVEIKHANCFGSSTGSASASATGGTGNYTYSWSNGMSGQSITNLTAGSYTVTVDDGNSSVPFTVSVKQFSSDFNGTIQLDGVVDQELTVETNGLIRSEQIINNNAIYDAGISIELINGFQVNPPFLFEAYIEGCDN